MRIARPATFTTACATFSTACTVGTRTRTGARFAFLIVSRSARFVRHGRPDCERGKEHSIGEETPPSSAIAFPGSIESIQRENTNADQRPETVGEKQGRHCRHPKHLGYRRPARRLDLRRAAAGFCQLRWCGETSKRGSEIPVGLLAGHEEKSSQVLDRFRRNEWGSDQRQTTQTEGIRVDPPRSQ